MTDSAVSWLTALPAPYLLAFWDHRSDFLGMAYAWVSLKGKASGTQGARLFPKNRGSHVRNNIIFQFNDVACLNDNA